jgi:hypothetical protein
MQITKQHIDKIDELLSQGLCGGTGFNAKPGDFCVEQAITIALGLPFSDNPVCVGSGVRSAKIALNDCKWSSPQARAKGMLSLAKAQLGSNKLDQEEFKLKLKLNSTIHQTVW